MFDIFTKYLITAVMFLGLPLVNFYIGISDSAFLSYRAADAQGLEAVGNTLLTPLQYLLAGKKALPQKTKTGLPYLFIQDFDYRHQWIIKTAIASLIAPVSLYYGSGVKGASFLFSDTRKRYRRLCATLESRLVNSNVGYYESLGIAAGEDTSAGWLEDPSHQRGPIHALHMVEEREALAQIAAILTKEKIPFWIDCGTCLGAYRYGGIIPWDHDIDIAILEPDSSNVRRALNALDPTRFLVQDWSSRDKPDTQLKVYVKNSTFEGSIALIDIYHYRINQEAQTLDYIFSGEENIFFPPSKRAQERRFKTPVAYDMIFPLKKALFDGIVVNVPNRTKEYLNVRYGSNLEPNRFYDDTLGRYVKIEQHPYWEEP